MTDFVFAEPDVHLFEKEQSVMKKTSKGCSIHLHTTIKENHP